MIQLNKHSIEQKFAETLNGKALRSKNFESYPELPANGVELGNLSAAGEDTQLDIKPAGK